ncbi:MAG: leucine-rich repeat domain-containing protein [Fibrobacteres bacterium]|jgi:Leucine-rich repeat (LRR) protein|nr:leucine-rich repeat domain-containing protein [Fibrobacterota bacterium]
MKNPIRFRTLLISLSVLPFFAPSARAQDLRQDTLAVRILLDQNGLTTTPVSQVAQIDPAASRVTALRLSGRNLSALPSQLGSMDALKYLVLSDNLLDSLPAEIWDLTSLVELDLGGNRIPSLDARVGRLQSLLFLGLRGNGLASLPDSVFALPQLETLLLTGNLLDTLPEAVANLPFLKYLDVSGNVLRALPFTMAAMQTLDTLNVSGNVIESLPESITQLKASTKVLLDANRLCDLDASLTAWANSKEPAWQSSQSCGIAVRPRARVARGPSIRAWAEAGSLRLDWTGTESWEGDRSVILRDASGREVLRAPVDRRATGLSLRREPGGFLWAELRVGNRVAAMAAVAP